MERKKIEKKEKQNKKKNIAVISGAKNKLQARKAIEDYSLMYKGINQDEREAPGAAVMADEKMEQNNFELYF